jgi:hypothetical protein
MTMPKDLRARAEALGYKLHKNRNGRYKILFIPHDSPDVVFENNVNPARLSWWLDCMEFDRAVAELVLPVDDGYAHNTMN